LPPRSALKASEVPSLSTVAGAGARFLPWPRQRADLPIGPPAFKSGCFVDRAEAKDGIPLRCPCGGRFLDASLATHERPQTQDEAAEGPGSTARLHIWRPLARMRPPTVQKTCCPRGPRRPALAGGPRGRNL